MRSPWKVRFVAAIGLAAMIVLFTALPTAVRGASEQEVRAFLAKIQDENADVRFAAWRSAGEIGAPAVVPLGKRVAGENKGVARAASEALNTIAHHASRPGADAERKAVSQELAKLLARGQPHATRVKALELLALTGGEESVPAIAGLLDDVKLREDARRELERIPGSASVQALIEALKKAPEEFRPAVIHSLGQKGATEALDALTNCAESPNKETALAAFNALSRIGEVRQPEAKFELEELSQRERRFLASAYVRFAEKRAARGDAEMALTIYRGLSALPAMVLAENEHFKCAGLIGMAKFGSASDVDAMLAALYDESPVVCNVAMEALTALKGADVNTALEKAMETAPPYQKDCISKILSARKSL